MQSLDLTVVRAGLAATRAQAGDGGTISYGQGGEPMKPALILRFEDGTALVHQTINP